MRTKSPEILKLAADLGITYASAYCRVWRAKRNPTTTSIIERAISAEERSRVIDQMMVKFNVTQREATTRFHYCKKTGIDFFDWPVSKRELRRRELEEVALKQATPLAIQITESSESICLRLVGSRWQKATDKEVLAYAKTANYQPQSHK